MSLDFGFLPHVVRDERRPFPASPTIYTALLSLPCSPVRPHDLDEDKGRLEARLSRTERTPKAAMCIRYTSMASCAISAKALMIECTLT